MATSYPPNCPYWVFLSFRGKDTRNNFTSYLYILLEREGVETFVDDDGLQRGLEISAEVLLNAIHESKIRVIIFSENYGDSKWCLDELQEIMEMRANGQVEVIHVFYKVAPSTVRHQRGLFRNTNCVMRVEK